MVEERRAGPGRQRRRRQAAATTRTRGFVHRGGGGGGGGGGGLDSPAFAEGSGVLIVVSEDGIWFGGGGSVEAGVGPSRRAAHRAQRVLLTH